MAKLNILFVVGGLHRAGAERFAYEVDRALNKQNFRTSIFCLERESEIPANFGERYYAARHQDLGTDITYADQFLNLRYFEKDRLRHRIIRSCLSLKYTLWNEPNVIDYLNKFDVIHWMGEYTYLHFVPMSIRNKSLIQPMSARFQNERLYEHFDFDIHYNFCSLFFQDELSHEFREFNDYDSIIFPLAFKISETENRWNFKENGTKKIGIFTRLNRYKPLDPFFYAFHLLLDKMPDCELHIFGAGDPETEGLVDYLRKLNITHKVLFRGHQEDIVKTALEEDLSLSWFQGYNNDRPSGYAGLDICSSGTPLICWDFHPSPKKTVNKIYPHYKNLNKFVNKSVEILCDKAAAQELSNLQFNDILQNRNIQNYIGVLENEYIRTHDLSKT